MIETTDLPGLNACLNTTAALLLTAGYIAIKKRNESLHKVLMLSATAVSALFLISYLIYHAKVGSVKYQGEGFIRTVYFTLLLMHTLLAVINLPLVILTLKRAFSGQKEAHRRIARITLPIWWIVSVSGVLVYLMLYKL